MFKLKESRLLVAAAVVGLGVQAQAGLVANQTINVNFSLLGEDYHYEGQGALPSLGNTWNHLDLNSDHFENTDLDYDGPNEYTDGEPTKFVKITDLVDSLGTTTSVGFRRYAEGDDIGGSGGWSGDEDAIALLRSYNSIDRNGGTQYITITGLDPSLPHNLIMYAIGNAPREGAVFTFDGTQKTSSGGNSFPLIHDSYVEGVNYVQFIGTPNAEGELTFHWNCIDDLGQYTVMNGFQIQAIPEPSALVLLGIGGLLMLSRRRL